MGRRRRRLGLTLTPIHVYGRRCCDLLVVVAVVSVLVVCVCADVGAQVGSRIGHHVTESSGARIIHNVEVTLAVGACHRQNNPIQ